MKYASGIALALLLSVPTGAAAHSRHSHRHHHHHRGHAVVARSFAAGLGHGLAHMLRSIETRQTRAGPIRVASAYADRFVGFINALVAAGYRPKEIGCYAAHGHMPHSKHHVGMACDIDQRSRNVTAKFMYHVTELAHRFHLTDGCEWHDRDCGHVEVPTEHAAHHRRAHYARG